MNNMKKNFVWNLIGSLVNSVTSLFFMIIVTRINGVDEAGIFTFAFSLACLFQVIANYSGRTFQVTNTDEKITDSDFIYHRYLTSIMMVLCVFVYLLFKDYSEIKLFAIFLLVLFRFVETIGDCFYGIIQKNGELYKVGISLFLKGIIGTLIFGIIDIVTKNLLLSIIGLVLVNLIIVVIYDSKNYHHFYQKKKVNRESIKIIFKSGFSVFGFTFLNQYLLNAPKYAIDNFLSSSFQTIYGIISMPATILILCSQFIVQPLLTKVTNFVTKNEYISLRKMTFKITFAVILIGLLGEVACYLVGIPFLELIYGISLEKYLFHLMIIIAGATVYGIISVISVVLIALRKNSFQLIFYGVASLFVMILSKVFVQNFSIMGACLSYLITMILLCLMYVIYFVYAIFVLEKKKEGK